jgi:polysaccharide export outer membrane protein
VFSRRSPPRGITLGIGDVVSVTIFEAEAGGLFVPSEAGARPGNFVTLPDQIVDSNGNITVPYAGTIRAAGRTPLEVQQAIIEALTRSVNRIMTHGLKNRDGMATSRAAH